MMLQAVSAVLADAGIGVGDRLCCALSGGVDSVVLLHLLHALQAKFGYRLQAAHVHHGLNPAADDWAQRCASLCERLSLPLSVFHVDVARDDPQGLEAAARRARHEALARVSCDWLVFGHHQDDQAETVLFRLLRGSGVRGAAAMAAVEAPAHGRAGRLRPLLELRRAAIESWARAQRLGWVEDDSNADLRHMRNDLRHRLLPACSERFPAAVPMLARASGHFREAAELLDELAAIDAAACGGDVFERAALLALSDARLANLLRWRCRRASCPPPSQARLAEAMRQLRAAPPSQPLRLDLGALACCAYRECVWLERAVVPQPAPCAWHGEEMLAWGEDVVELIPVRGAGLARAALDDAGAVWLQPYPAGRRFRPEAQRPSRSLRQLCQQAGIPAWLRARLPVLTIDGEIAWVGGIGVATQFACAPGEPGVEVCWSRRG